ncbi:type I-E CRISPR-associated protein Cse2/CasB [Streptomyces dubilierae]|uniref:Type I-E CRISPR-associated protein Cse2/CasB n=1 Tax=Streptomyces dubilierae TaxID=3075533 RepID=A0ABU2PJM2_9ACTN|nr:type I-E CRISPR-associated protein Cse2/CasB [Streptomyces sp. DSM 41921]MDT0392365.1 type I-E CRISPR-associated protein Cse2/CasB [Streptomyces sp. DSM 41921]
MTDSVPAASAPPPSKPDRVSDRFVAYVHRVCASTQTRAALRRGLGLPVERCNYMHRYLVPWLRDHDDQHHGDVRRAYYAVASLIAARPRSARDTPPDDSAPVSWYERCNLGDLLGQAVAKGVMKANSAESALHLMARQSSDAIHPGLPALIRQLQSGGITVDWAVLLEDLAWWNRSRDRIATRWLESYFRTAAGTTDPAPLDSVTENDR